jgi:hypothetical protein
VDLVKRILWGCATIIGAISGVSPATALYLLS